MRRSDRLGSRCAFGRRVAPLLACAFFALASPAHATAPEDDAARSNARQLATDASEAYRAAQYDMAYDRFNRAYKLVGVPALGVWSARSLERGGRLVEASERYREVLANKAAGEPSSAEADALREARLELDELLPRIPNLIVRIQNAEPSKIDVKLDGARVATELLDVKQRVNPGKHTLTAQRGSERFEQEVTLGEREVKELVFQFEAERPSEAVAPAAQPQDQKPQAGGFDTQTVGLVSIGVGAAFLASGIVTGVVGLGQESALVPLCPERNCPESERAARDELETMKTLSTIGFIGAGVFGALGATLFIVGSSSSDSRATTARDVPRKPEVALRFAPTSAHLFGTF